MGHVAQSIGNVLKDWSPVFTGFTANNSPSNFTAHYTITGNWCTCWFTANSNGVSNATTFTITLPRPAASSAVQIYGIRVTDQGTIQTSPGMIRTRVGSSIADIFKTYASGAFTNDGLGKSCAISAFKYEMA